MKLLTTGSNFLTKTNVAIGAGVIGLLLAPVVVPMITAVLKPVLKGVVKGGFLLLEGAKTIIVETKDTIEEVAGEAKGGMIRLLGESNTEN
jgi:hypothetical protein